MKWTFFNLIILLGVVQGMLLSLLTYFSNRKKVSNKLIGLILFFLALASFGVLIDSWNDLELTLIPRMLVGHFPFFIIMPVGPLLLLYFRSLLEKDFRFERKDIRHFLPAIIDFLPFLAANGIILLMLLNFISVETRRAIEHYVYEFHAYADIPRYISMVFYSYLAYQYLKKCKKSKSRLTNIERVHLSWLSQFHLGICLIIVIWTPFLLIYITPLQKWLLLTFYYFPIYIPLAIFIYWASIKWYFLPKQVEGSLSEKTPKIPVNTSELKVVFEIIDEKIKEEKLFLDPDLSINKVSKVTNVPGRQISAALNQYLLTNFSDYINKFRIDEFKAKVTDKKLRHLTLDGLAYESGFKSRATFHRTLKKLTGLTPSEFKSIELAKGK